MWYGTAFKSTFNEKKWYGTALNGIELNRCDEAMHFMQFETEELPYEKNSVIVSSCA